MLAIVSGIGLGGSVVWQASYSAFSATTTNGTNSFSAGTVSFGTNSPATAAFTVTGARPGSTGTACVQLTYTGSLTAAVKMYLTAGNLTGTGLGTYLTWQVDASPVGAAADCSDFGASSTITNLYNSALSDTTKTLSAFSTASHDYASGVDSWSATTGANRTYRLIWKLQDNNAAQGLTASATFTWEAQNT